MNTFIKINTPIPKEILNMVSGEMVSVFVKNLKLIKQKRDTEIIRLVNSKASNLSKNFWSRE